MKFDAGSVQHLAGLARLELPVDRAAELAGDLSRIVGYVEALAELDGIDAPMTAATPRREDLSRLAAPGLGAASAGSVGGLVRVPRVVDVE